jgi:hypothetical protein
MPVDELGRRAARDLRAAAAGLDENAALATVTDRSRNRNHRTVARVVVVCAVAALVFLAAAAVRAQLEPGSTVSPAGQVAGAIVGRGLSVPARLTVPSGWVATRDGAYVRLVPADGSDRSITVTPADRAFDPPDYARLTTPADFTMWSKAHPALTVTNAAGGPWGGHWVSTQMDLALNDSAAAQHPYPSSTHVVPLVPLPGDGTRIAISDDDQTFRWAIVTTRDGDLLIAARSATPRDRFLWDGFNALAASLRLPTSGKGTG